MPKARAKTYLWAPWSMKEKQFSEFTPVTAANRKNAIILGRVLYVITKSGNLIQYRGHVDIHPRLVKCRMRIENHPFKAPQEFYIPEEQDKEAYKKQFDGLITSLISEGSLFVKLTDPIIKYLRV